MYLYKDNKYWIRATLAASAETKHTLSYGNGHYILGRYHITEQ